jgi:hypothetical protein
VALSPLLALYVAAWIVDRRSSGVTGDEADLLGYAGRLLDGHYAITAPATGYLWHGPGLPGALAPLVAVHAPLWLPRLALGPVTMFAAAVGLASVLRHSVPGCRPRFVAALFGLYLPALSVVSSLHKEPLAALLVIVAMGATSRALRGGSKGAVGVAGVALAGLTMTRVEYGWVLVVLIGLAAGVVIGSRTVTAVRASAILGIALALCVPWLAYTRHVSGRFPYWGNSGGLSLYWMSSPDSAQLGEWHAVHTVLRDGALKGYRPLFRRLRRLPPAAEDARLTALAVRQALGHPAKYTRNLAANVGRMAVGWPFGVRVPWWGVAGVTLSNVVLLTALLARRRRHSGPNPRPKSPETWAFAAFAGVAIAVHLLPSTEPRMIIPVVPLLVWLAAARQSGLVPRRSPRRP